MSGRGCEAGLGPVWAGQGRCGVTSSKQAELGTDWNLPVEYLGHSALRCIVGMYATANLELART